MPVFELRDVSLSYPHPNGQRQILRDVSFTVADGEVLTICGASGTGKTSLLRIMAGLIKETDGAVRFRDSPLAGPPEGVAIVFQDYVNALLQWRTVARNVALGIERSTKGSALVDRVMRALRLVGLERNVDDYPWQLSGGMQQRVQIARALALDPSVLLMDEPFAALDAMTRASLQDELMRLRDETGTNIVFITHDIDEAIYLGDRVAVLCGAPSKVAAFFEVKLSRPRDQIATRAEPEFLALRQDIHAAIRRRA
jgi:NitT/TauT family transport system ATP-binding protein